MKSSFERNQHTFSFKSIYPCILFLIVFAGCTNNDLKVKDTAFRSNIIQCGTVQFSDGCNPAVDSFIAYGLALVHHMTYDDAEIIFDQVIETNPDCFWGYWGKALTYIHPLWPEEPTAEKIKSGLELTKKAMQHAKTTREKAFGEALASYYNNGSTKIYK